MDFDVVIIGAGVVGLAVGRSLVKVTTNTCIIDQNQSYGMETSSRNSEVIHSGIYYPKNSLKSKLCIEGNQLIYDYCDEKLIPYKNCGKLIIANDKNGLNDLQLLKNNAEELGIVSKLLNKDEIKVIEPLINADYALKIKSSGVVDSHALMTALYCEISDNNLSNLLVEVENVNNGEQITYFEILTAAYFYHASKFKDKINIIESGLFHRFDATNIIDTNLSSIVTSIGLDHLDWLPKNEQNIEKIIYEKTSSLLTSNIVVGRQSSEETIKWLKSCGVKTVAATPDAPSSFTKTNLSGPIAIAVGTEQLGLSKNWMENADIQVSIPMNGVADSLNVATATTLLLYEVLRQRS